MVGDFILWKSLNNASQSINKATDALTMQADAFFLLWRSQIAVTDGKTRKVN
ncbi:MAG: hypothetical protein V7K48_07635 [Nostoc sp.]|uniref:hypothetical protein n=1 Tax=Nostoc sp. TaxID=1180 RepID=UPI002FF9D1C7